MRSEFSAAHVEFFDKVSKISDSEVAIKSYEVSGTHVPDYVIIAAVRLTTVFGLFKTNLRHETVFYQFFNLA